MATVLAQRPEAGTLGTPLKVKANLFELTWRAPPVYAHYKVVIKPEAQGNLPRAVRRNYEIMQRIELFEGQPFFQGISAAYDGKENLYTSAQLAFGDNIVIPALMSKRDPPPAQGEPGHFRVSLTLVGAVNPRRLTQYVQGGHPPSTEDVLQILNCLNVVLRQAPMQHYTYNAHSFFMEDEVKHLGMGLRLVRGFFQSVRPASQRLLVNIDVTTGIMWEKQPLLRTVLALFQTRVPNRRVSERDLKGLQARDIVWLTHMLKGVRVTPTHRKGAKPRPILRFDAAGVNRVRLEGDGRTIEQYLRATYPNRPIRYPDICCVWLSSTAALPLEFCEVQPGQLFKRKPSPEFMRDVLKFSQKAPSERFREIGMGPESLLYQDSHYVRAAGLSVDRRPVVVEARKLPGPRIQDGSGTFTAENGQWNMKGRTFYRRQSLAYWAIVWITRSYSDSVHQKMLKNLISAMKSCGMNVVNERPRVVILPDAGSLERSLLDMCQEMQRTMKHKPQMIVAVFDGGSDVYYRLKRWGNIDHGCPTQCLRRDKVQKEPSQYYANVAMKLINTKLGGVTHRVHPDQTWLGQSTARTVVFGADVSHPHPGPTDQPSISALAGSVDVSASQYVAAVRVQQSRTEIITDLADMVRECLIGYEKFNTYSQDDPCCYPARILFYRDGVSEGQFEAVCAQEVPAIRKGFKRFYEHLTTVLYPKRYQQAVANRRKPPSEPASNPPLPTITFVVIGKRHHIRFLPELNSDCDRSGNAKAGLVVDTGIVHPYIWDFYLGAHAGLLGTSRTMHVSVLLDENQMTQNELEAITFAMCHNFPRTTKSISTPSAVRHAHIVSGQGKLHLGNVQYGSDDGDAPGKSLAEYRRDFRHAHSDIGNEAYWC